MPSIEYKILWIIPCQLITNIFLWMTTRQIHSLTENKVHLRPSFMVCPTIGYIGLCSGHTHSILGRRLIYSCTYLVTILIVVYPFIFSCGFILDTLLPFPLPFTVFILISKTSEHQIWVIQILANLARHGSGRIALTDGNGHRHLHLITKLLNVLPYPLREVQSLFRTVDERLLGILVSVSPCRESR